MSKQKLLYIGIGIALGHFVLPAVVAAVSSARNTKG